MSRYERNFKLNADPVAVYNAVDSYLLSEKYIPQLRDGVKVYKRGKGYAADPTYFQFDLKDGILTMYAWAVISVLPPDLEIGEYGLDKPFYILTGKKWKECIGVIENMLITQFGCNLIQEPPVYFNMQY